VSSRKPRPPLPPLQPPVGEDPKPRRDSGLGPGQSLTGFGEVTGPPTPAASPIPYEGASYAGHSYEAPLTLDWDSSEATRHDGGLVQVSPYISRARTYAFVIDEDGNPIELGSGRFAKAYLGEERWVESKTTYRRNVAIKILQRGVSEEDAMRFQMEKEILERVQGHNNIIELLASGEGDNDHFVPPQIRDRVENDFMILELLDMSLEERLKGSRTKRRRDDLLAMPPRQRMFRVLDYMVPVASAIEYSHLIRDTSHRDIKPANILIKLPDPTLRGSQTTVKLADFNVGKLVDRDVDLSMTSMQSVPGTLYFQSPEQETNTFELLVNVTQGSPEVEFFEDFYIDIHENDAFGLFNRGERYPIASADRSRKKLLLAHPFNEASETNVRAKVTKAVGRPADIYSLGALLYYLASGAYANPKSLYDAFRKFIEYEKRDENNTIASYIDHEYRIIQNLRAPKTDEGVQLAPEDRFFTYTHYLDGNGELIDWAIMLVIAKAMIRNKPDSYCTSWDLRTTGIQQLVHDLLSLYVHFGVDPSVRFGSLPTGNMSRKPGAMRRAWDRMTSKLRK
jgi:serine/threonine protein kinase